MHNQKRPAVGDMMRVYDMIMLLLNCFYHYRILD